jgi:hypothetical protein
MAPVPYLHQTPEQRNSVQKKIKEPCCRKKPWRSFSKASNTAIALCWVLLGISQWEMDQGAWGLPELEIH